MNIRALVEQKAFGDTECATKYCAGDGASSRSVTVAGNRTNSGTDERSSAGADGAVQRCPFYFLPCAFAGIDTTIRATHFTIFG